MALDKLVDSTQLDSDLTSVANAIRTKGGTSAQLAFPADFVSEIQAIPSGETVYQNETYGDYYKENMDIPSTATYGWCSEMYRHATHLKSFICHKKPASGYQMKGTWEGCSALETVVLEVFPDPNGGNVNPRPFENDTALKSAQLGSIGNPCSSFAGILSGILFKGCTQSGFTITVFVDAADLASVPTNISNYAPFGATNATIVYRSSTTGEVLT